MSALQEVLHQGQHIWYDHLSRRLLDSGDLARLVSLGVSGVTAHPTILEQAISKSQDYDVSIESAAAQVRTTEELYEWLVTEDIGRAADVLRPAYERSDGCDGFVSLEVSPYLANDAEATVREGRRWFSLLGRPNVMIKVPATPAGIPAVGALLAEGVNVNITLIFSLEVYLQVMQAFLTGLELRLNRGYAIDRVASVASFFVSRVDVLVDSLLDDHRLGANLRGQAGIANAVWPINSSRGNLPESGFPD